MCPVKHKVERVGEHSMLIVARVQPLGSRLHRSE